MSIRSTTLLAAAVVTAFSALPAQAAIVYYDTSDDPGLQGGAATWSTAAANWNNASDGSGPRANWVNTDSAVFNSAGTYTVTASGTPQAALINFQQGSITFSGTVALTPGGDITVDSTAGATTFGTLSLLTGSSSTRDITNNSASLLTTGSIARSGSSDNHSLLFTGSGNIVVSTITNIGSGTLTKSGAGTFTLNGRGNQNSSNLLSITGGVFDLGTSSHVNTATGATALSITNNATLRTNHNRTTGISSATHGVTLGTGGGTFEPTGATTLTLNGVITGGGQLTKSGTGTLVLGGANNYTGNTTIEEGTLALGAAGTFLSSPTVTVGDTGSSGTVLDLTAKAAFAFTSSQTLQGIGTVNIGSGKTVTIEGAFAPGNSIGTLSVTGNLALTNAANYEINSTLDTEDLAIVSGSVTFGGALNVTDLGAIDDLTAGDVFDLFNFASSTGSFSSISLPSLNAGLQWVTFSGAGQFDQQFDYINGLIEIESTSEVPEPASLTLLALGGLALLTRRRRA